MTTLLLAKHDNKTLNDATAKALTAVLDALTELAGPAAAEVGVRRLRRWDEATAAWLR